MTDKEQIMLNGVDVSECEYLTYQLEEDGQYYWFCKISPTGGPDECEYNPECFYKRVLKQLARKTQECEKLKEKLYRIEDVIGPINKQLPKDIIIKQIMLILDDCNNLEPSYYQKTFQDIQNLAQSILDDFESDDFEQQLSYCQDIARHIVNIAGKFAKGYVNE